MIATTLPFSHKMPRPTAALPAPLCLSFPAQPAQVGPARRAVSRFLREAGWTDDETDAVMLAVGEACNNAVDFAAEAPAAFFVTLHCALTKQGALVEVRNPGAGFEPDVSSLCALPNDTWATHGRGFALMSVLMDKVQVSTENGETVVRLFKAHSA